MKKIININSIARIRFASGLTIIGPSKKTSILGGGGRSSYECTYKNTYRKRKSIGLAISATIYSF